MKTYMITVERWNDDEQRFTESTHEVQAQNEMSTLEVLVHSGIIGEIVSIDERIIYERKTSTSQIGT